MLYDGAIWTKHIIIMWKLKYEIKNHDSKETRRGELRKFNALLNDNLSSYMSAIAKAAIVKLGFEPVNHSSYSPYLTPSDYRQFPKLKESFARKNIVFKQFTWFQLWSYGLLNLVLTLIEKIFAILLL